MSKPLYTRDILRLASMIGHLGLLDEFDGKADLRAPTCGSRVVVTVRLADNGTVAALGQTVTACAFGQASAALMAANAFGRSAAEIAAVTDQLANWLGQDGGMPDWPGIAALAPALLKTGRYGAIMLPFRALLTATDEASAAR